MRIRTALTRLHALSRQRAQLDRLPEHMLRDLGITRAEARREAARAPWDGVWDAPARWRR